MIVDVTADVTKMIAASKTDNLFVQIIDQCLVRLPLEA